ncbi:hypothetical protein CHS0354_027566 [Potamilus streckersoni]|uniref:BZIP domain-containing protein n=1 Tax=Potamilus streckersoni TaxID=2493646 RepID=A0AAE0VNF5_9BIVA|nr:hypothetical protein CHS0354_027566 [Potamilus streckersoni]
MTDSSKFLDVDEVDILGIAGELNDSTECDDLLFYLSRSSSPGSLECGSSAPNQLLPQRTTQNVPKGAITPSAEVGTNTYPDQEDEYDNDSERSCSYYPGKRKLCTSRNAVMARENRERKKKHLQTLETNIKYLTEENKKLKECSASQKDKIDSLQNEVIYLRSVIANESSLSSVLNKIVNVPGLKFSTSFGDENNSKNASTLPPGTSSRMRGSVSTNSECCPLDQNRDKNRTVSDDGPSLSCKRSRSERGDSSASTGYSKENDVPKNDVDKRSSVTSGGPSLLK